MNCKKLQKKLDKIDFKNISVFIGSRASCANSISIYHKDDMWYVYEIDGNGNSYKSKGIEEDMCRLVMNLIEILER